jgi:outer membrane protein
MSKKLFLLGLIILFALPAALAAEPPAGLSLDQALQMAYTNNQQLKVAAGQVAIAEQNVKKARAAFGPSLDYQIYALKNDEATMVGPIIVSPEEIYGADLTLTQPLSTFGRLRAALHIAEASLQIAKEEERKSRQSLTASVTSAYYQLWLAGESLVVAQDAYDNIGRHYEQVRKFYDVGLASKYDLLRAQVQWENLKPQVIQAQNGVALAKLGLTTLTGYPREQELKLSFSPESLKLEASPITLAGLLDEANRLRPELLQIKQAQIIAHEQVRLAAAGYKPAIALNLTYSDQGMESDPATWDTSWTLTLGIRGNLFSSGSNKATLKAAKENELLVAAQQKLLLDQVRFEAEQALQNLTESLEIVKALQATIGLARESLRLTQARYDAGMATTMDIMDAQLALNSALNGYHAGLYAYLNALARLDLVAGRNK